MEKLTEEEIKRLYDLREANLKLFFEMKTVRKEIEEDTLLSYEEKLHHIKFYDRMMEISQQMIFYDKQLEENGCLNNKETNEMRNLLLELDKMKLSF